MGTRLEEHLEKSVGCLKYYLRNFKIKSVLPIIVKEFSCLFCNISGPIKITAHLKKNDSCLKSYLSRFNVNSIKEVQTEINKLKKQLMPSSVNRKLELQKMRKKYEDHNNQRTQADLVNNFLRETSFGNVLSCFKCHANYNMSSRRIKEASEHDEVDINDENVKIKRRFQKFFSCVKCIKSTFSDNFKMNLLEDNDKILFFPRGTNEGQMTIQDGCAGKNVTLLIPCTIQVLDYINYNHARSQENNVGMAYKINPNLQNLASIIYENEVNKYRVLKLFSERYEGTVSSDVAKTLRHAERVFNDSSIVGSEAWRCHNSRDYTHRLQQLGNVCIQVIAPVSLQSDVMATIQVQEGHVVTVDYIGNSTNEQTRNYFVHLHKCDIDCFGECEKNSLQNHLNETNFDYKKIKTNYLTSYLSLVQTKFGSLIRNFIKAQSSPLYSETFYLQLFFNQDNSVEIRGLIWPMFLRKLNEEIGKHRTTFDEELKMEIIRKMDSLVTASVNRLSLANSLKLSNDEADKLCETVMKTQYHRCIVAPICQRCEQPNFPLLVTCVLEWSDNLVTCNKFKDWVSKQLIQKTDRELSSTSTEDWLKELISSGKLSIHFPANNKSSDDVSITIDGRILKMKIDERMQSYTILFAKLYPDYEGSRLLAIYHYLVSTVQKNEVGGVIMKRLYLIDSYVTEFNIALLKAFSSEIKVSASNGNSKSYEQFRCDVAMPHWTVSVEVEEGIGSTHQEVTLAEAMTLMDKNFIRSYSSNPVEFICAVKERKKFFRKVKEETPKSFKLEGSVKSTRKSLKVSSFNDPVHHYEPLLTKIERYFLIRNPVRDLCLCQFIINYDYVGESDSKDLFKLFTKKDVAIKDSEKKCVGSDSLLPEFILLKNGDVMKLRSNPKIVVFPRCEEGSMDYMFQKVLLFSPEATENMSENQISQLFHKCEDGENMTLIQRIER